MIKPKWSFKVDIIEDIDESVLQNRETSGFVILICLAILTSRILLKHTVSWLLCGSAWDVTEIDTQYL